MREDMAKLLVERPRRGGGGKYPRSAYRDRLEDQPQREPIKSPHIRNQKWLNENLAPLRRYLRSNVGRPWDKVYGEICQRINRDSAVQLHIWQHLMWEVTVDPRKVAELKARGPRWAWREFHVDPRTKLLCETRVYRSRREPKEPFLVERNGHFYKQVNEVWFEITLQPHERVGEPVWDALLSRADAQKAQLIDRAVLVQTYGRPVFAVAKRQLNSREVRRLTDELEK